MNESTKIFKLFISSEIVPVNTSFEIYDIIYNMIYDYGSSVIPYSVQCMI